MRQTFFLFLFSMLFLMMPAKILCTIQNITESIFDVLYSCSKLLFKNGVFLCHRKIYVLSASPWIYLFL